MWTVKSIVYESVFMTDKTKLKITVLGFCIAHLLRLWAQTLRVHRNGIDAYFPVDESQQKTFIIAFWHDQQIFMPWALLGSAEAKSKKKIHMLISQHDDGRIAAKAIERLGFQSVAGSSSRGSVTALRTLERILLAGGHVAITPDGPRGPRHTAKVGAVSLAAKTGCSVLPAALKSTSFWQFRSWDKMFLPKPFSRIEISVGAPISVPQDSTKQDLKKYALELEDALKKLVL